MKFHKLGPAANRGQQFARTRGDQNQVTCRRRLLEGFEQRVLGILLHQIGLIDDEKLSPTAKKLRFPILDSVPDAGSPVISPRITCTDMVVPMDRPPRSCMRISSRVTTCRSGWFSAAIALHESHIPQATVTKKSAGKCRKGLRQFFVGDLPGMVAEHDFRKFQSGGEFAHPLRACENPGAGQTAGRQSSLNLGNRVRLAVNFMHEKRIYSRASPRHSPKKPRNIRLRGIGPSVPKNIMD